MLLNMPWQCRMGLRPAWHGALQASRGCPFARNPGFELCRMRAAANRFGTLHAIGLRGSPTCTTRPTANGGCIFYVAVEQPRCRALPAFWHIKCLKRLNLTSRACPPQWNLCHNPGWVVGLSL